MTRYDRWVARTERPLLALALLFLLVLGAPIVWPTMPAGLAAVVNVTDKAIWLAFAVDYVVRLRLVEDKRRFMTEAAEFIGVPFADTMLYPSWNGVEIKDSIAPWGTVLKSTKDYNQAVIQDLSADEIRQIAQGTAALARHFRYDRIDYLAPLYNA